ncbi:tRNA (adenosine(37)-N6)-threonylcarbamoyltransferase complex dimerization subunit type 1 TsaB [Flavitalea antarctica]
MALILNIDTSTEIAYVSIGQAGIELGKLLNRDQKDHASWIHEGIRQLFQQFSLEPGQLEAIAVTAGPGSYTGIRVGMATAKGLAYALSVPLITENTLRAMAWSQLNVETNKLEINEEASSRPQFYAPMIDARRDEVFTGVYDTDLNEVVTPLALKLDEEAYSDQLQTGDVCFFGSGSVKWKGRIGHKNAHFLKWDYEYFNLVYLTYQSFLNNAFADLAYVPPYYLKEVYTYKKN